MRRTEIWFFGLIFIALGTIPFQMSFPDLIIWNYVRFWWVLLVPYVIIRLFFQRSKLFKWLETEVWKKNK